MGSEVKVSVCVVTYNQEKYIAQCLQSLIDQKTDFKFEIIVSDDCSTDGTKEIIQEFANKYPDVLKPIFHKENIGAFKNFIVTHDAAVGEYVCHIDGDDYWLSGKLKYQADFLDQNKDFVQIWSCAYKVNDNGLVTGVFPSKLAKYVYPSIITSKDIASSYAIVGHHSTQMYRRSARVEIIVPDSKLLDYWFAFNYGRKGKSYYSKRILSVYRVAGGESLTRSRSKNRVTVDVFAENLLNIYSQYPECAREIKANLLVRYLISKIVGHDLLRIKDVLNKFDGIPFSKMAFLKSLLYFAVQKL